MKNKKGFTLIELLAVIVILAIIALIAVPQILRILNNARKSAAEDTVYGVAESANTYISDLMLDNSGDYPNIELKFECNGTKCSLTSTSKTALTTAGITFKENLEIKGKVPKSGTIKIASDGRTITGTALVVNSYTCSYLNEKASCNGNNSGNNTTASNSFASDSWSTIAANVRAGKTENYHVGDTKILEMDVDGNGEPEKYSLRIVNTTTPSECSQEGFSQTACGFVVEFGGSNNPPKDSNGNLITKRIINAKTYLETATSTGSSNSNEQEPTETATSTGTASTTTNGNYINDIITVRRMNPYTNGTTNGDGNKGGWEYSELRNHVNTDIYNLLPSELKNVIKNTTVVSGHGPNDSNNFTTTDKLYLLSTKEIGLNADYDTAKNETRILDYYNSNNNDNSRTKKHNGSNRNWWLRSANYQSDNDFYVVNEEGNLFINNYSYNPYCVSLAFRIG